MSGFTDHARHLMTEQGVSLRGLAKLIPCDQGHLSKVLAGRKRPSPELAGRIDAALGAGGDLAALPYGETLVPAEPAWALDVLARVEASDTGPATLEGMHHVGDRLARDYPDGPAPELHQRTRRHLNGALKLLSGKLTLAQHREVLVIAGWSALLAGCLEQDMGATGEAETTRRVAASLGSEAGHAEIIGWAYEMAAWFALTAGDNREAIAAARAGLAATRTHGVAAQLHAQEAKARARLGDTGGVSDALAAGRGVLEALPLPDHPEHHFVVDPTKQDFYEMDCFCVVGDDTRAVDNAREVLRLHTNPDGSDRAPMRMAEARLTLATVDARRGDLEAAVHGGKAAMEGPRRCFPSLLLLADELATEIRTHYPREQAGRDYADYVRDMRRRHLATT